MDFLTNFHDPEPSNHKKNSIKIITFIFLLIILFFVVQSCHKKINKNLEKASPILIRQNNRIIIPEDSPLRNQLVVQNVQVSKKPHHVIVPGVVEADPRHTVNIFPALTGHLVELKVTLGQDVKQTQLLATMESAGLAQAYAEMTKTLSVLKQTKEALNRAQKVNQAGANSVKEIEQIQNNHTQALADVTRAQETLKALGNNEPNQLLLQAPIDGKVIALNYGIGSYINDLTTPILTISNIQSVWITACVPERLIAYVKKGQKAQVSLLAYPHQPKEGTIAFVNNFIDPEARCNKTRISLTNHQNNLQPNMFASVHMELPQQEQVFVPITAVLMNDDDTLVYVEVSPWIFEPRFVKLGAEDNNVVRITSGIKAGDRIVVLGGILVND